MNAEQRAEQHWHNQRTIHPLPIAGKGLFGHWDDFREWLRRLFS